MIIVKNRELLIPGPERYIGTTYDTESENRQFLISRFAQNGVDLSALTFHLDLKYANDAPDTVLLDKEVTDTNIILTWNIGSSVLQVPGTLFIQLRAVDDEVTVKWSSFHAALYVERHLNTPGNYTGSLTEIEQMEQDHQYMKGVVDELKSHLDYTHEAEAWAIGKKDGEDVPSTDETYHNNSKYYSEQANASKTAAANSATAAANSATQAAETVTDTNNRFNNAMSAVTSETEVIDARVGADGTVYTVLKNRLDAEHTDVKTAISPLANGTTALTPDYTCVGYYYNPTTNAASASANFETLKYNVPDECIALVIHSNFYASRIVLANDDSTAASFPSLSFGTVLKYPNVAPVSPTDVDITIDLTTVGDYKYIYVPHYVGNHDAVTVSAITRGQVSMLEYYKVDSAGRKRKQVMTGDDIFTTEGFTSGYILIASASGITTQENANYGYTDYIDIKDVGFVLEGMGNTAFSVIYNESKQVVGTGAISNFLDTSGRPDGTKYIRFNVALSVLSSVKMLTYNIEWETYIKPSQVYGGYTDITVGTGKQYTSIVSAVEYANSIASNENTVNVYIYPGTYDVIGDYDLSEQTENWVGLTLADHVNLIGVGSPDDIVLVGELPEDISGYAITRNNVSTLNFWKNNSIKNLTITAKNMRYCLHNEDGKVYAVEDAIEIIKNCKFIYYERDPGATYISMIPVGIGATAGRKTTFSHCVFDNQCSSGNYPLLLHNNTTTEKYCEWTFDACDFVGGTMNSLKLSSSGSGQMEIVNIVGCRLPKNIRFDRQGVYTGTACEYKVYGHGNAISGTESWDGVVEDASVTEMLI